MLSFVRMHRIGRVALLGSAVLLATCLDDDPTPRPVPTFSRITLTFTQAGGGAPPQNISIERSTGAVSGPLTVPAAGGTIVARYLNADGTEDTILQKFQPEYETRIFMTSGSNVTFSRAATNSYNVTRNGTGTGTAKVQLYDIGTRQEFLGTTLTVNTP